MPHLIIERLRTCPCEFTFDWPRVKASRSATYLIEVFDIIAAVIFVVASVCFLPSYSMQAQTYFLGCNLFLLGSIIYCFICTFTFSEALATKGISAFEVWENGLYLLGSLLFLFGSVMYLPLEEQDVHNMSLGQICDTFNILGNQWLGTILFIIGSVLFVFAAFTNLLNQPKSDGWSSKMLSVVTSFYMGGSLLFTLGSTAFLPHLGCGENMVTLGAWCWIVGSVLFLLGGVTSLWRTTWILNLREGEGEVLVR
mmetsp:Transcript_86481/g.201230  ORF Transcript_86481/g.201230 Transcript_86481/m.201230 type:complete len:254 (+) Transcript_86481:69-830(+)|eukprot:CAMPEP_0171101536 /NCGR_PEP_ID=MMETSP0766_2-20121228/55301_1 /TAXON_ID=439317 /ORGANISM="Gambierdiscus australes, Strain CAWD 149" /LENGTH=253 /DNA_ID=CAMNT_0011561603 /DNA_START=62 /DNA_END=823 /DNA_ORIENTATION=+